MEKRVEHAFFLKKANTKHVTERGFVYSGCGRCLCVYSGRMRLPPPPPPPPPLPSGWTSARLPVCSSISPTLSPTQATCRIPPENSLMMWVMTDNVRIDTRCNLQDHGEGLTPFPSLPPHPSPPILWELVWVCLLERALHAGLCIYK